VYLQLKITELQIEEEKLRKIINIVRPTTLPELTKPQIEHTPKVEEAVKVNPKLNNGPSPITSTIPKEVKKIDTKIKPNIEEKVEVINKEKVEVINKEKSDLNEAEGIIIELKNNNQS